MLKSGYLDWANVCVLNQHVSLWTKENIVSFRCWRRHHRHVIMSAVRTHSPPCVRTEPRGPDVAVHRPESTWGSAATHHATAPHTITHTAQQMSCSKTHTPCPTSETPRWWSFTGIFDVATFIPPPIWNDYSLASSPILSIFSHLNPLKFGKSRRTSEQKSRDCHLLRLIIPVFRGRLGSITAKCCTGFFCWRQAPLNLEALCISSSHFRVNITLALGVIHNN